jgi:hypothetical protein
MIDTSDVNAAMARSNDRPLDLAIACLAVECDLDLVVMTTLDDTQKQQLLENAASFTIALDEDSELNEIDDLTAAINDLLTEFTTSSPHGR